jgi:hypothetical protein
VREAGESSRVEGQRVETSGGMRRSVRGWANARLGFDQRKVGDEVGRDATMLSKARRHSAFLVSSVDGSSAGQIVVASAWTTVPAIAQTQSREGPPREKKVCGLPRERTGCTEQRWWSAVVSAVTAEFERRSQCHTVGPQRLQGSWCRKMAVSWQ